MRRRLALIGVPVVLVAGLAAGCGDKANEPYKDAPRTDETNGEPASIVRFPDGFSNIATKCDHGNRLYVAFKGDDNRAAIAVVQGGCR